MVNIGTYPHELGFVKVDVLSGPRSVGEVAVDVVQIIRIVPDRVQRITRNKIKT